MEWDLAAGRAKAGDTDFLNLSLPWHHRRACGTAATAPPSHFLSRQHPKAFSPPSLASLHSMIW